MYNVKIDSLSISITSRINFAPSSGLLRESNVIEINDPSLSDEARKEVNRRVSMLPTCHPRDGEKLL